MAVMRSAVGQQLIIPRVVQENRKTAVHKELQEAVNDAAYALHYPFTWWDMSMNPKKTSAYILYQVNVFRGGNCIPPPPPGTYGTPEEVAARLESDQEDRRMREEERRQEMREAGW